MDTARSVTPEPPVVKRRGLKKAWDKPAAAAVNPTKKQKAKPRSTTAADKEEPGPDSVTAAGGSIHINRSVGALDDFEEEELEELGSENEGVLLPKQLIKPAAGRQNNKVSILQTTQIVLLTCNLLCRVSLLFQGPRPESARLGMVKRKGDRVSGTFLPLFDTLSTRGARRFISISLGARMTPGIRRPRCRSSETSLKRPIRDL